MEAFRCWRDARKHPERDGPITAQEALTWLASLADRGGLAARSIAVYKCALHRQAQIEAHPDSTLPNPLDSPLIKNLLTGIENVKRATKPPVAPKDTALTFDIVQRLAPAYGESERDLMLYAAVAFGVATASRPSEMFGSAATGLHRALIAQQVRFYADDACTDPVHWSGAGADPPRVCELHLYCTKTKRDGETKLVSAPIAVQALWRWMRHRRPADSAAIFECGGRPLTIFAVVADLRRRLAGIGLGHMVITGKCFRRGAASTLAGLGLPDADIAAAAWAPDSQMWQTYASDPQVRRVRALMVNRMMQSNVAAAAASSGARPGRP